MNEILKAIHRNLSEINVKGQDVFRMANAIQLLEHAITTADTTAENEKQETPEQATE